MMADGVTELYYCPACGWPTLPSEERPSDYVPAIPLPAPVTTSPSIDQFVDLLIRPRPDVATLVALVGGLFTLPTVLDVTAEEPNREAVLLRVTTSSAPQLPLQLLTIPAPAI